MATLSVRSHVRFPFRVGPSTKLGWCPPTKSKCWGALGSDEKAAVYVERKLLHKLSIMVDRLADFDDIQSAFFLLRTSFSIVRATHFMRTTPLAKWRKQAKRFDKEIWDAAQNILGLVFSEQSWKQACLTPRLGGLGLRKIEGPCRHRFLGKLAGIQSHLQRRLGGSGGCFWSPITEARVF